MTQNKNRDFTLTTYRLLLESFLDNGYRVLGFRDYLQRKDESGKFLILRHDVDRRPQNALDMAKLEADNHVTASYFFRVVKASYDEDIMREIADLDHEIGYHYEDLSLCKGNFSLAVSSFKANLEQFRKIYPVQTLCMHGSPLAKWDNRSIWDEIDYRDYGIIGEPYYDLDFKRVFYLTDTGRRWNGYNVSVRDRVDRSNFNYVFRSSDDIIVALRDKRLPNQILMNTHPERWTDGHLAWTHQWLWQNTKNIIKRWVV